MRFMTHSYEPNVLQRRVYDAQNYHHLMMTGPEGIFKPHTQLFTNYGGLYWSGFIIEPEKLE